MKFVFIRQGIKPCRYFVCTLVANFGVFLFPIFCAVVITAYNPNYFTPVLKRVCRKARQLRDLCNFATKILYNNIQMTYYFRQASKVMNDCYSNKGQLDTVIGTRHYINNNFDQELNLNLLSKVRFTSKFHLLRLFKRYYGQTPKQYLIEKRIEQAKALLKKETNITDTCFEVGFDSPSSFSTLFKSRVGRTPTEFQKRATFTKSD